MRAHSLDLRKRIVEACKQGKQSQADIAVRFGVSFRFVSKVWSQWRRTGSYAPLQRGGRRPRSIQGDALRRLKRALEKNPDATLEELREASGVDCTLPTVHNTLKREGYRRKKNAARR